MECSKVEFKNIFIKKVTLEDVITVKEMQFELDPLPDNRAQLNKVKAKLKRFLKVEEEFWRQKSGMQWFMHGDRNSKFFHSYVQMRRKKLQLNKIMDEQGTTLKDITDIDRKAVDFYMNQFKEDKMLQNWSMLNHIPKIITERENECITKMFDKKEMKRVVF